MNLVVLVSYDIIMYYYYGIWPETTLYSKSQLMLCFRIVVLMYPISVIMHMLNILDSFNMGVTIKITIQLSNNIGKHS